MQNSTSPEQVESEQNIEQVRTLILGENSHLVTDTIKKEARDIVGDVFSEALHDRQRKDGSVNKVLMPLVEESVAHSVSHHSDKLVTSLYPLMGSLIRKSVAAFLTDFMEKTNQLIENSFTFKGLKWRFQAWQSGVSFAQYVAAQTFVYRVEHVFLIHRETGLLLNSINLNSHTANDADLISSMLTAINDFVGDSFSINEDGAKEQLQTVSTDTFNLLIKPGPSAAVVAAVIGNPPQKLSNQLQLTLENIHSLYGSELSQFSGDNGVFDNAENLLQDCLLSKQKSSTSNKKKTPWFAWLLVIVFIIFAAERIVNWWGNTQLSEKIMELENQPGVVIKHLDIIDNNTIKLNVLRDPEAISIREWFAENQISIENIDITEHSIKSLDVEILKARANRILLAYPKIKAHWQEDTLTLSGNLEVISIEELLTALNYNGFTKELNLNIDDLQSISMVNYSDSTEVRAQLFEQLVGRISATQLDFPLASSEVTVEMEKTLQNLHQYIEKLNQLADELNINFGLLVMGCSDNSGNKQTNEQLSLERAENVSEVLNRLGINRELMFVTGLGQIELSGVKSTSRKVMFNVIYVDKVSTSKK